MKEITPILYVRSIEDAVTFYQEKLGFDLGWAMNGPDGRMAHAVVNQGSVNLMLGYKDASRNGGSPATLGGGAELYINMDDVNRFWDRVRGSGAAITEELTDQFWGDRTFTVTDPDGYVLTFSQTVREFDPARDMPVAAPA